MRKYLLDTPKHELAFYSHPSFGYELGIALVVDGERELQPGTSVSDLLEPWDPWAKKTGKVLSRTWGFSIDLLIWSFSIEYTRKYE